MHCNIEDEEMKYLWIIKGHLSQNTYELVDQIKKWKILKKTNIINDSLILVLFKEPMGVNNKG